MEKFRKLRVWEKAHALVLDVYKLTSEYPKSEQFGLVSQMRRAAVSIAANIAEGTKRRTDKDKRYFLTISQGSLEEVKYYIILSVDLNYMDKEESIKLTESAREIGKMLNGLSNALFTA